MTPSTTHIPKASGFLDYVRLPPVISAYERRYLARMNRIALVFFLLHPPVLALVAWANDMSVWRALAYSGVVLVGPGLAHVHLDNPRWISVVHGVTSMLMGGLLVHFGQGPMQIEMHFYFFVLLALQAMFANPTVIVASALTAAIHHLVLFYVLPSSVFNYDATLLTVLVHALFVVLESAAACFVARSFFDDVIGLDALVQTRTAELDSKNRDLQLVLDNVEQGFVMIDVEGRVCGARSAAFDRWFGPCEQGAALADVLTAVSPTFGQWLALGLDDVATGVLPRELTIAQLPTELSHEGRELRFDYQPIERDGTLTQLLVVVTDVTASLAQAVSEREDRELAILLERSAQDPTAVTELVEEATSLASRITDASLATAERLRAVHTLKGNAGLFGLGTIASLCHDVESRAAEGDGDLEADTALLARTWMAFRARLEPLLRRDDDATVRVPNEDLLRTVEAAAGGAPVSDLALRLLSWTREPVSVRFARMDEQIRHLAARLGKPTPTVHIEDHGVRLPRRRFAPLWGALVHGVRNAVDHGIEPAAEREAAGKPAQGRLELIARRDGGLVEIVIRDDGRGIDWAKVRASAAKRGLPHATRAELEAALFADGLSTRDQVTELSGRGVGMAAVREAAHVLGGELEMKSEEGVGTTLVVRVPLVEHDLHRELEAARRSLWPAAA
jgi:two-component system chemotaxis sensor kinase CheA